MLSQQRCSMCHKRRSEGQIRAWFARLNLGERQLGKSGTSSITSNTGSRATQGADQRHAESIEEGQEGPSTSKNVPRQPAVHFSDPSTAEFAKWVVWHRRQCVPCEELGGGDGMNKAMLREE